MRMKPLAKSPESVLARNLGRVFAHFLSLPYSRSEAYFIDYFGRQDIKLNGLLQRGSLRKGRERGL